MIRPSKVLNSAAEFVGSATTQFVTLEHGVPTIVAACGVFATVVVPLAVCGKIALEVERASDKLVKQAAAKVERLEFTLRY